MTLSVNSLVTLDEAKLHLRVDNDVDDEDIELKVEAAESAVLQYIGDTQYLFLDTGGEAIELEDTSTDIKAKRARRIVRQAILLTLGDFYKNREPASDDPFFAATVGYGYLPRAVLALLYPLRDPTIA